jgi:hypothetical protein
VLIQFCHFNYGRETAFNLTLTNIHRWGFDCTQVSTDKKLNKVQSGLNSHQHPTDCIFGVVLRFYYGLTMYDLRTWQL